MYLTHLFPQRALGKSWEVWGAPERSGEVYGTKYIEFGGPAHDTLPSCGVYADDDDDPGALVIVVVVVVDFVGTSEKSTLCGMNGITAVVDVVVITS